MKTLIIEGQLTKVSRLKDMSVNLGFHTMREVSSEEFKLMDEYFQQNGWLAFKMNDFGDDELPKENAAVEGMQTPSQYLRRCLFAKFIGQGGKKEDFPAYYNRAMEGFAKAVNDSWQS
jgi:hypothetical protein